MAAQATAVRNKYSLEREETTAVPQGPGPSLQCDMKKNLTPVKRACSATPQLFFSSRLTHTEQRISKTSNY